MARLNLNFILFTTMAVIISTNALAQELQDEFKTDYDISYKIEETGIADVVHEVTITNLKDDVIATTYSINLKQADLYDVTASDNQGQLKIAQDQNNEQSTLNLKLNDFVIGEGRQNTITIKYKSKTIATKIGEIWNINIPKTQPASTTTTYKIALEVPNAFGPKIYVSPTPSTTATNPLSNLFNFYDEVLRNKNITASFGKYQVLNFKLKYQLENPNHFTSSYDIALPPTVTNFQIVAYENFNPKPASLFIDKEGNHMARYYLKPKQKITAELLGSAKITNIQIDPAGGGGFGEIPKLIKSNYTKETGYWQTENPQIKAISTSLNDKNLTVAQNALKIYEYMQSEYTYDFDISKKEFVDRKGAVKAINDKSEWGCMEFTDTFIALARSMGIPAREINGYAITAAQDTKPISVTLKSGDLLHAWPEFYDPKFGWVQIDPTWGNTSKIDYFTKLDTSHLVFVIKGENPDLPLPAGTYRFSELDKLVEVGYSQIENTENFEGNFVIKKLFNWNVFNYLAGTQRLRVTNLSKIVLYTNSRKSILPNQSLTINVRDADKELVLTDAFGGEYSKTLN